ncbi:MAG: OST-HTH/LOTUS domain-containing protein, partial [Rhodospirillaceae bacterium]
GIRLVLDVIEDLFQERGEEENVWGSMVKQTLKRRKPGFSESYHGYRSFADLLKDAEKRGLVELTHDEKSGGYIVTDLFDED